VPSLETIALFMASALVLNLTPGPAILFILSRSFGQGRAAAVISVFGLATASVIRALAVAFGLSALFVFSPLAFAIVKYCGAAYLVYLGIAGFLSGGLAGSAGRTVTRPSAIAGSGLLARSVDRPAQPEAPAVLLLVPAAIRRPGARRTQSADASPRAIVPGHRRADQSGGGAWRRNARRADRAPPVLGRCSALVFERGLDRARYPAGVERPSLTG
jgi:LysE type translocator